GQGFVFHPFLSELVCVLRGELARRLQLTHHACGIKLSSVPVESLPMGLEMPHLLLPLINEFFQVMQVWACG
ncbi:hypothetical protein, partial [Pseudomonas sp. p99-361]|uniref:hypothetical protein n=1 Tax=Pseudomonas sp. p99-361 TaxID=2479852 RepID=UPI001C49B0EA